jgi:ATP-binding cassette subfamily F protein 3
LLRSVTQKLWLLHDRHVTEFAGGFAEWEMIAAEGERAAAIRTAEEAALRRVHERQQLEKTRRAEAAEARSPRDLARELRRVQREVEALEAAIAKLEAEVAQIGAELQDPALYTRPDGARDARLLAGRLERAKTDLDAALERWSSATEQVEGLSRELSTSTG